MSNILKVYESFSFVNDKKKLFGNIPSKTESTKRISKLKKLKGNFMISKLLLKMVDCFFFFDRSDFSFLVDRLCYHQSHISSKMFCYFTSVETEEFHGFYNFMSFSEVSISSQQWFSVLCTSNFFSNNFQTFENNLPVFLISKLIIFELLM